MGLNNTVYFTLGESGGGTVRWMRPELYFDPIANTGAKFVMCEQSVVDFTLVQGQAEHTQTAHCAI